MRNLTIDAQRLWDTLMETAAIGGTPKGGIRRLTLSDEDRRVRDWFKLQCEALGCIVTIDAVGNMFALRPGRDPGLLPIAMGSHLDTQPTGGKFDGVLGVLAGLEALRTLDDLGYQTNAPLMLVNWTNEEGSRFAPAMLGSGVHAGVFEQADADANADRDGVTFAQAIEAIGYRGGAKPGATRMAAMFELHIEQGPILEDEGIAIGVVQGVQGMRWYEIEFTGQEAHTGATPMRLRRNALVGAAQVIDRIDAIAKAHAPFAVGAVGLIEVTPNSRNVVPGRVFMSVDFRHPEDAVLEAMEEELQVAVAEASAAYGLAGECRRIWHSPPVSFHPDCIAAVRAAAAEAGHATRDLISGAGHDAAHMTRLAPSTMIFVPCAGGVSHNEAESASFADCAAGAQVLLRAVLRYDQDMADRRDRESQ